MKNKELKTLRRSQFKGISFRLGRIIRFAQKTTTGWFGGSSYIATSSGKKNGISFERTQGLYKGSM
jgi:hypothetical protein